MKTPAPAVSVRCPDPACATVFPVPAWRLGRNLACPDCAHLFSARPLEVEDRLRRQEHLVAGGAGKVGAALSRLPLAVLLDNVRSLWNVGSLFRTADACGARLMVLAGITGHPPRREISKTALGAEEAVPWRYRADALAALDELVAAGYTPVALENSPHAVPLENLEWPPVPCLVVGNEVAGISPAVLEKCALHAYIPMLGVKDSLNVSVAFGIAAYDAARALRS